MLLLQLDALIVHQDITVHKAQASQCLVLQEHMLAVDLQQVPHRAQHAQQCTIAYQEVLHKLCVQTAIIQLQDNLLAVYAQLDITV